jgi:hypothetical protein
MKLPDSPYIRLPINSGPKRPEIPERKDVRRPMHSPMITIIIFETYQAVFTFIYSMVAGNRIKVIISNIRVTSNLMMYDTFINNFTPIV